MNVRIMSKRKITALYQTSHKAKQSQDKKFSLERSSSVQAHPTPPVPSPSVNLDESIEKFLKKSK